VQFEPENKRDIFQASGDLITFFFIESVDKLR
jgi:hypothetical protein